jgi:hypothetical protein
VPRRRPYFHREIVLGPRELVGYYLQGVHGRNDGCCWLYPLGFDQERDLKIGIAGPFCRYEHLAG